MTPTSENMPSSRREGARRQISRACYKSDGGRSGRSGRYFGAKFCRAPWTALYAFWNRCMWWCWQSSPDGSLGFSSQITGKNSIYSGKSSSDPLEKRRKQAFLPVAAVSIGSNNRENCGPYQGKLPLLSGKRWAGKTDISASRLSHCQTRENTINWLVAPASPGVKEPPAT